MTAKDIPYINTMFISIECLYLQCPELVLIEDGGKKKLRKLTNHIVPNKAQRLLVSATNGE